VHAPDENVRLDLMPKAAMVLGRFFDEFSRT
jgi:acetylornithine deacetylase/succinyl-diaminopimelate desuccinylase-like protein